MVTKDIVIGIFSVTVIAILIAVFAYYIFTASYSASVSYVKIMNFSQSQGQVVLTGINYSFDPQAGTLYFTFGLKNNGSSAVDYQSGCTSPFNGTVYPARIANLVIQKNTATCGAISQNVLLPGESGSAVWPYTPKTVRVLGSGNFFINLTFYFGHVSQIYPPQCVGNETCSYPVYVPNSNYSSERLFLSVHSG